MAKGDEGRDRGGRRATSDPSTAAGPFHRPSLLRGGGRVLSSPVERSGTGEGDAKHGGRGTTGHVAALSSVSRQGSDADTSSADLWVFGYGSLMWRPGFPYLERQNGLVRGWRRTLCIYSWVHRGTPEKPGLVLGLDRGGACHGAAFRVAAAEREATIAYLREREQVTSVYLEKMVRVLLWEGALVEAITYVADRNHPQYAGALSREELLRLTSQAVGGSGPNDEYILNTVGHLEEVGIKDATLEWLAERLREAQNCKELKGEKAR
jgi:cation transport protein ChaC